MFYAGVYLKRRICRHPEAEEHHRPPRSLSKALPGPEGAGDLLQVPAGPGSSFKCVSPEERSFIPGQVRTRGLRVPGRQGLRRRRSLSGSVHRLPPGCQAESPAEIQRYAAQLPL